MEIRGLQLEDSQSQTYGDHISKNKSQMWKHIPIIPLLRSRSRRIVDHGQTIN
jgi:hypothetical protein